MRAGNLETGFPDFWDWSLKAYNKSGVADIMLGLQDDYGFNVNLILWCLWAGEYHPGLEDTEIAQLLGSTQDWQKRVTIPLRNIRKDMKKMKSTLQKQDAKKLRREVKRLELESERLEQLHLAAETKKLSGAEHPKKSTRSHMEYLMVYQEVCAGLELSGELGIEDRAERVRNIFLLAKNTIFSQEIAFSNA